MKDPPPVSRRRVVRKSRPIVKWAQTVEFTFVRGRTCFRLPAPYGCRLYPEKSTLG